MATAARTYTYIYTLYTTVDSHINIPCSDISFSLCACAHSYVCVCACVRACVRACARARALLLFLLLLLLLLRLFVVGVCFVLCACRYFVFACLWFLCLLSIVCLLSVCCFFLLFSCWTVRFCSRWFANKSFSCKNGRQLHRCMHTVCVYIRVYKSMSPWYNRNGWLGVKHQVTYKSVFAATSMPIETTK